jgi:hypothetical protein
MLYMYLTTSNRESNSTNNKKNQSRHSDSSKTLLQLRDSLRFARNSPSCDLKNTNVYQ